MGFLLWWKTFTSHIKSERSQIPLCLGLLALKQASFFCGIKAVSGKSLGITKFFPVDIH